MPSNSLESRYDRYDIKFSISEDLYTELTHAARALDFADPYGSANHFDMVIRALAAEVVEDAIRKNLPRIKEILAEYLEEVTQERIDYLQKEVDMSVENLNKALAALKE